MKERNMNIDRENGHPPWHMIHLPAPTAWPIMLALGTTFLFAGLVTNWAISLLGFILMVRSSVGWFQEVLPRLSTLSSLAAVLVMCFLFNSLRNEPGALRKWPGLKLRRAHPNVQIHHKSSHQAEGNLRRNEP